MAQELNEDTTLKLSIKTLGGIAALIFTLVSMWFMLQADIAKAMELPVAPDPEVTRKEFDMKDRMIRQTIMDTKADVDEMKKTLERIEDKLYNR